MTDIDSILWERAKTHGRYSDVAAMSQQIKMAMRIMPHWSNLSAEVRESLEMIAVKMARIVCGGREKEQHFEDVIGYAELTMGLSRD